MEAAPTTPLEQHRGHTVTRASGMGDTVAISGKYTWPQSQTLTESKLVKLFFDIRDFKISITRDKQGCFEMIQGSVHQENIILNFYNDIALKHIKQKIDRTEEKVKIHDLSQMYIYFLKGVLATIT